MLILSRAAFGRPFFMADDDRRRLTGLARHPHLVIDRAHPTRDTPPMTDPATTPPQPAPTAAASKPAAPRPRRTRRWLIILATLFIVGLIAAELVGRLVFRLGDPPLYMADPEIEYRMVPSSQYERFNAISKYNQWSMRSGDFPEKKTDTKEFRMLVMGDSVVNGGPQTDQSLLATELLRPVLASQRSTPVVVANISCGSWGPPNLLAYVKKFGTFDADCAAIVLNHEDAADVPTFAPLGRDLPTRKPILALEEAVFRYIPLWLSDQTGAAAPTRSAEQLEKDTQTSLAALRELIDLLRSRNVKVVVVLHAAQSELEGQPKPGTLAIRSLLRDMTVPVVNDLNAMREAQRDGREPYRDDIHLLAGGQAVLAEMLHQAISEAR